MTPCREYAGARNSEGYGYITRGGKNKRVHRYVVEMVGEDKYGTAWDDSLIVLHECDNPPCFLYDHLRLGTPAENVSDCRNKRRNSVFVGENHGGSRLTDEQVMEGRRRYAAGEDAPAIAADYGVSKGAMTLAIAGVRWSHLPGAVPMRPRGGVSPITGDDVKAARVLRAEGRSWRDIGRTLGVDRRGIQREATR